MKKHRFIILASALFLLLVLLGLYICPVWAVVGIPCPACGMTRAVWALLQLDFAEAFDMHPGVFLLILWAACVLVSLLSKGKRPLWKNMRFHLVFAAVFLLIYVFRMVFLLPNIEPMIYNTKSLLYRLYCVIFGFALY